MMTGIPPNLTFQRCIERIGPKGSEILDSLDLTVFYREPKFQLINDVGIFAPPNLRPQSYIAAFDMDWTISYGQKK